MSEQGGGSGAVFRRVLVALDGSEWAEGAVPHAEFAAERLGARLWLASAAPVEELAARRARLEALVQERRVAAEVTVEPADDPAAMITGLVDARRLSGEPVLVCMATRARRLATAVLGSCATAVVREGVAPVLLVGPAAAERGAGAGPVLVPLDGSRRAEAVLPLAAAWARAVGVRVELRQVLDPATVTALTDDGIAPHDVLEGAYLARVAAGLAGVEVNWDVLHGEDPAAEIVRAAAAVEAGWVAMATHGRTGAALAVAGSVALAVVHDALCPVLVTRPEGLTAAG